MTPDPFLHRFEPALETSDTGGSYERGRRPCDDELSSPLWVSVTRFAWICEGGAVIALDATLGHEAWVAELPVEGLHEWIGRTDQTTAVVNSGIVDATMFTIPAEGLGAETYELTLTSLNAGTGEQDAQLVFPTPSDRYVFWWSPTWSRVVVAFLNSAEQRRVVIIDTTNGDILADRTDIGMQASDQQIEGRYLPVSIDGNEDTLRFLDITNGTITPAETKRHLGFEFTDQQCSPYLLVKTGLRDNTWELLDPTKPGPSNPLPDRHWPELLTADGALIRGNNQWAMLTLDGVTWTLDSNLATRPNYIGGELSFRNQSGEPIAVDAATGTETGPAQHAEPNRFESTIDGTYDPGSTVTYLNGQPCP